MLLINEHTDRIEYLSQTYAGATHDKKATAQEEIHYPAGASLAKDTGFQGYEPLGVRTLQPKKKPKGKELSLADRFFNRVIASVRIRIEHVIASVKRCRIVKDVFRNTKTGFSDLVMQIACALHNFRVSIRHPVAQIQLLDYFR